MSPFWFVVALLLVAFAVLVLLVVRRNSLAADDAVWTAEPAPATSFDEHARTATALLDPDADWDTTDHGVAAGVEAWLAAGAPERQR